MTTKPIISAVRLWFYQNIGAILIWFISMLFVAGATWANFNTRLTTVEAASVKTEALRAEDRRDLMEELAKLGVKVDEINIYLRGK